MCFIRNMCSLSDEINMRKDLNTHVDKQVASQSDHDFETFVHFHTAFHFDPKLSEFTLNKQVCPEYSGYSPVGVLIR